MKISDLLQHFDLFKKKVFVFKGVVKNLLRKVHYHMSSTKKKIVELKRQKEMNKMKVLLIFFPQKQHLPM